MPNHKHSRYEMHYSDSGGRTKAAGYIDMKASAEGAELYIYGEIWDDELYASWYGGQCPQMIADFMRSLDRNAPLTVYFNSPGGDVFAGLAIHSILKRHPGHKTGQVDGMAASIASVILMGCDTIQVNTGAQIMVHNPWTYAWGNARDLREVADQLDNARESMLDVYMNKALDGVTREDITALLDAETWMRYEKAAQYFDVTPGSAQSVPAAASVLYGRYRNTPETIKNAESKAEADQKAATALLDDLYLFGTAE